MIDLHLHSTASDGRLAPEDVVQRAATAGLAAMALTDHDSVGGVPAAIDAGRRLGVSVIGGCEFSVAAPWGEMHLLAYFLPPESVELNDFLNRCRADRTRRAGEIARRLQGLGVSVTLEDIMRQAAGGSLGRPHVARAVVEAGAAADIGQAFDLYLGRGRPAYVDKVLPTLREVADLVHGLGGVVSAAHLKDRGSRPVLERLQQDGLDAVEIRHPSHSPDQRSRLTGIARVLGLGRSGGSDWHGETNAEGDHSTIGSQQVPADWLAELDSRRRRDCPEA